MIRRVEEWPKHLQDLVEMSRFEPFAWGQHDCGTFACQAYRSVTGISVRERDIAFPRDTAMQYLRILAKQPEGLLSLAKPIWGDDYVDKWQHARRGDIAIVESPRIQQVGVKQAMGVVLGGNIATPGLEGLEFLSLSCAVKVWRVGT
jgi:hypothetical protein